MSCPNCVRWGTCCCTWDDKEKAFQIRRVEQAEYDKKIGRPHVIDIERNTDNEVGN